MRAHDIATVLAARLPFFVDDFTNSLAVATVTRSGSAVTVTTSAAHSLSVGSKVNMTGAQTPIACSIVRSGILATITTTADHDYTEESGATVIIAGATEAGFNGTFTINTVPNRRTVTFVVADSGATIATGSPLVLNGTNPYQSYNGLQEVTTVPSATTFTYESADSTLFTPASGTIVAKTAPRVGATVSVERIIEAYTQQPQSKAWLFVVLNDGVASKNKNIDTDATDNIQRGQFFNQRIIQNVSLYLFLPTADEISGRDSRDRAEELLRPICQSILMEKFDGLTAEGQNNPLQFLEHGFEAYNAAFYVHRYTFQMSIQMTGEDVYIPNESVAFRDIGLVTGLDVGAETFTTEIDLDDVPL
jgi:hypothetical protein